MFDFTEFLVWLATGGGAGAVAYWLVENVPWLVELQARIKRYVAYGIAILVGWLAYGALGAFNVWIGPTGALPTTWQEWVSALFYVGAVAIGGSQIVHAERDLKSR